MRIHYNAPIVLNYTLLSALILLLDTFLPIPSPYGRGLMDYFTVFPVWEWTDPFWYPRFFTHIIGHSNWEHLASNFTLILLLGPILEEKYGSTQLLIMILFTALVTGLLQVIFFDSALLGASGVVFMMILLASFANARAGHIPLTFILVVILFLGKEVVQLLDNDQISQFTHIIGGICGAMFGFALVSGDQHRDNKPLPKVGSHPKIKPQSAKRRS